MAAAAHAGAHAGAHGGANGGGRHGGPAAGGERGEAATRGVGPTTPRAQRTRPAPLDLQEARRWHAAQVTSALGKISVLAEPHTPQRLSFEPPSPLV